MDSEMEHDGTGPNPRHGTQFLCDSDFISAELRMKASRPDCSKKMFEN